MKNITREYDGAKEKGLEILWDDQAGEVNVDTGVERISFYDDGTGKVIKEVEQFINEF